MRAARVLSAALALLAAAAAVPPPAAAGFGEGETRALVVGIDAYRDGGRLRGSANDARLMAGTLRPLARETVLLLDAEATRPRILGEWRRLVAASRRGDTLFVHFSGHGTQRPSRDPREGDGRDEAFVTVESGTPGQDPLHGLILDDEIDVLAGEMDRRGLRLVLVADTCHSGGLTRGACSPEMPCRSQRFDPSFLPATPLLPAEAPEFAERANVVFVAAGTESELVRERRLDGRMHGTLSVVVSRALRGEADADGDGRITHGEFDAYVVRLTRRESGSLQNPSVRSAAPRGAAFLRLPGAPAPAPAPDEDALFVDGAAPAAGMEGLRLVGSAAEAAFVWQVAARRVLSRGDVVAHGVDGPAALREVLRREAAIARLDRAMRRSSLDLWVTRDPAALRSAAQLRRDGGVHAAGTVVSLVVPAAPHRHALVFNVSAGGLVQPIAPHPEMPRFAPPRQGVPWTQALQVGPPFGVETLLVLSSPRPLDALRLRVERAAGAPLPETLVAAIEQAVAQGASLGLVHLFTEP